jgi:mono/diheme cytochrome c family protein
MWPFVGAALIVLIVTIVDARVFAHVPTRTHADAQVQGGQSRPEYQGSGTQAGWQLPENARDEKSPVTETPALLKKGKSLYDSHCQKCHGPQGKGDGPDGEPEHKPADLTDAFRAPLNPDGVMFYKVWNGRTNPKMPAFKSELSRDEVWAVVEYAKTLRKSQ